MPRGMLVVPRAEDTADDCLEIFDEPVAVPLGALVGPVDETDAIIVRSSLSVTEKKKKASVVGPAHLPSRRPSP